MDNLSNVKGVKFIHMNTRSLYRRLDEIRLLYSNYDFICCSETWLDDRYTDDMLHIDDMKLFRLDRLSTRRGLYRYNNGGGVCIYVNSKWASFCTIYGRGTICRPDFEILTLKIEKPNFKKLLISVVYKPPKGDCSNCIEFFSEFVSINRNCESWILGDFNTDLLKRNVTSTKKVTNSIRSLGLTQLIHYVTRPAKGGGTCIDWILTNSEFVSMNFVSNNLISDHYPVVAVRKKAREYTYKEPKFIRLYNRLDLKTLGTILVNLNWGVYDTLDDVDEKWEFIKNKVRDIIVVMCPLKKIFVRKRQPPWIDGFIFKLIRDRERLSRLFRNTGDSDVLREFKIVRNKVTESIRKARSVYINLALTRNKNDPRKFWRMVNSLYNNTATSTYDGSFVDPMTGIDIPSQAIPSFLNDYFATIGTRLNTLHGTILDDIPGMYDEMGNALFSIPEIDSHDIMFVGKEIDVHKSSCIPEMRSDVCKYLFEIIPDKIADLYNTSLTTALYPTDWSLGYVNLIPKQGDLSNPSNWRPITQTNLFGKNLEKLVHKHLLRYFLEQGVITDRQYVFLPGRSTQEAIFDLVRHIYSSINNKKLMGLLFLDISKAFDCILHERLLLKLREVGCDVNVLRWFASYLHRKQVVTYNGVDSPISIVPTGIGQGTILGPLIFIFYMNDIVDKLFYVKVSMYADDCVLYMSGNNWTNIRQRIQED